jgi:hypothetical protein
MNGQLKTYQLKNAIEKTVQQFQEHPLDFLSERDIQALLFVELRNATNYLRYTYDAEGENHRFGFEKPFCLHPVTTEYFAYHNQQDRFDIAVLSEMQDSKFAIWHQPCRVAIEIKLWQPGYGEPNYRSDIKKLHDYQKHLQQTYCTQERKFTGIAMLFIHPCAKGKQSVIFEGETRDAYPENGIALHLITQEDHLSSQVAEPVALFA